MQLEGIDHVALGVRDVEQSANWYVDVLGFERRYEEMWDGIPTFIAKGNTAIALFPLRNNDSPSARRTGRTGMLHLAFRANRENFLGAQEELKSAASNSNFRTTRFRTPFISVIPTATNLRSLPTSCEQRN